MSDIALRRAAAARTAGEGTFVMPPTIRTRRLTLERLGPAHIDGVTAFFADADSTRFIGGPLDPAGAWTRLAMFAGQWSLNGFGQYAMLDEVGAFRGLVGLWYPHGWPEIEIAYSLMPDARGQGFAAEAVRAVHALAMELGAPSLVSYVDPDNDASQRVALEVGAETDGTVELRGTPALVLRYPVEIGAVPAAVDDEMDVPWEASAMPLVIETARLRLTQWTPAHLPAMAEFYADPERFTGAPLDAEGAWRELAVAAGHWAMRGYGVYAVELDGEAVGGVGLWRPMGWPEIELAWNLLREARGKGYAEEAARAVRAVAAEQGRTRLVSYVHPRNLASMRLAERLGCVPGPQITLPDGPAIPMRHPMDEPLAKANLAEPA